MMDDERKTSALIKGSIVFPAEWTVFAPCDFAAELPSSERCRISEELTLNGLKLQGKRVNPTRGQYDFAPFFGAPADAPKGAYVFVTLQSSSEQEVTLGMGADYYMQAWVNGELVLDTMQDGNVNSPPSINDFRPTVRLAKGENLLVVRFVNGKGPAVLALGGPEELRKGDFTSIIPPRPKLDAKGLCAAYPADPQACVRWVMPERFDPNAPDLGFEPLKEAEHMELFHALRSGAAIEDGGTGVYESLQHGTWNHSGHVAVFKDRLIGAWHSHARDEGGPGVRVLARVGKVLNDRGDVDWGTTATNLFEIAPAPVPVRRRQVHSDHDAIRGAQARGAFCLIEDRLFFCGHLAAKHGVTTDPNFGIWQGEVPYGKAIPSGHFFFGKGPEAPRGGFVQWDLGFRFYQEWGVRDDRFCALSPLYRENDLPATLQLTPELTLPLEPLTAPYRDAPLLSEAPRDFREIIVHGTRIQFTQTLRYLPNTSRLAHDGLNGLAHRAEFKRPDGSWVAIRENQYPSVQPFYYAAEKPDAVSYYPPARRTNLFGAVNPFAGELPDGRAFLVGNSPNRRTMFLTVSSDGRVFDKTWFLLHRQLSDYTSGAMKREGGPGSGPQYFKGAVIGKSLWLIYSISKEHIGATRVPIEAL